MNKPTISVVEFFDEQPGFGRPVKWLNIVIESECLLPIETIRSIMFNARQKSVYPLHEVRLRTPYSVTSCAPTRHAIDWTLYLYGFEHPQGMLICKLIDYLPIVRQKEPTKYAWLKQHDELTSLFFGLGMDPESDEYMQTYYDRWFTDLGSEVLETFELPEDMLGAV